MHIGLRRQMEFWGLKNRSEEPNETFGDFYLVKAAKGIFWRLLPRRSCQMKLLGTFTRSKRPNEIFGVFYRVETAK